MKTKDLKKYACFIGAVICTLFAQSLYTALKMELDLGVNYGMSVVYLEGFVMVGVFLWVRYMESVTFDGEETFIGHLWREVLKKQKG